MLVKSDFDITEAIRFFNTHSVEATYLVPTAVGLGKSIMDATSPLRLYLKEKKFMITKVRYRVRREKVLLKHSL